MVKPFDKVIGIIGGGQLGKMLIESASPWNVSFAVLDEPAAPAMYLADKQVHGKLTDARAIRDLAGVSDVLTYEIEHIDVDTLIELEQEGKTIIPSSSVLKIIRDKGLQKEFYRENNLPTAPFVLVDDEESWQTALADWKENTLVVKSRQEGYDGKGVYITTKSELVAGKRPFSGPSLLEQHISNATELAVIIARNKKGEIACFPVVEMEFDPEANLVNYLFSPANISLALEERAKSLASNVISALDGVGIFAVEMFLSPSGELFINEIAPRPHNSGHHTIEACYTSQYEQLIRILLDLPLGSTAQLQPALMINILGPEDVEGEYKIQGAEKILSVPGVYLHLYNKKTTRHKRKMGHCTILADNFAEALQKAETVRAFFRLSPVND